MSVFEHVRLFVLYGSYLAPRSIKGSGLLIFFSEMSSLNIALTLVRGPGRLSALATCLAPLLLFSALPQIQTALPEIETALPEIEIALPEIETACCKSRFILGHNLDFWQGGLDFWQGGLDSKQFGLELW